MGRGSSFKDYTQRGDTEDAECAEEKDLIPESVDHFWATRPCSWELKEMSVSDRVRQIEEEIDTDIRELRIGRHRRQRFSRILCARIEMLLRSPF